MRQKPLLLALAGAFAFIVFSSSKGGPFNDDGENRTGAAGSTANCSGTNCHANNATTTVPTITITEGRSTTPSTTYTAGKTYTVHIGGTSSVATQTKFGFQFAPVLASNTSATAGTIATANTSTAVRVVSPSLSILEHTAPIAGALNGGTMTYATTATWTAPHFGSGPVKFYLTVNAVNADDFASGDRPNNIEVTFNESNVGVANTNFGEDVQMFPNPVTTAVHIQQKNAENGNWYIHGYDMRGACISAQQVTVSNGTLDASINTANWLPGLYQVQLIKDGRQKAMAIVKE